MTLAGLFSCWPEDERIRFSALSSVRKKTQKCLEKIIEKSADNQSIYFTKKMTG